MVSAVTSSADEAIVHELAATHENITAIMHTLNEAYVHTGNRDYCSK